MEKIKVYIEIEKFSKFPEYDFPTGKQGPLTGFPFWESISIILDYRQFLGISAPIRIL
jgi:hypothetical protein